MLFCMVEHAPNVITVLYPVNSLDETIVWIQASHYSYLPTTHLLISLGERETRDPFRPCHNYSSCTRTAVPALNSFSPPPPVPAQSHPRNCMTDRQDRIGQDRREKKRQGVSGTGTWNGRRDY